jgi:hypothetical protein
MPVRAENYRYFQAENDMGVRKTGLFSRLKSRLLPRANGMVRRLDPAK